MASNYVELFTDNHVHCYEIISLKIFQQRQISPKKLQTCEFSYHEVHFLVKSMWWLFADATFSRKKNRKKTL